MFLENPLMRHSMFTRSCSGRKSVLLSASLLAACAGAALTPLASAQINFKSDVTPLVLRHGPALSGDLVRLASRPDASRVVVQLAVPVTDSIRADLRKQGMTLLASLGANSNAFFARLDGASLNADALATGGMVIGVAAIETRWKLHSDLTDRKPLAWAVIQPVGGSATAAASGADDEILAVYINPHEDIATDPAFLNKITALGGEIRGVTQAISCVVAHLSRGAINQLVADDQIQWIEPAIPQLTTTNDQSRSVVGANIAQSAPYGLTGAGVSVFVFDGGKILPTHQELTGRVTLLPFDNSGTSSHATHVAGTIGAGGAGQGGLYKGMAPGVSFLSAGVEISGQTGWLYTNIVDVDDDYGRAIAAGADLSNNSIGTNTAPNGFDCNWHGDYGNTDALIDSMARGNATFSNGPLPIVWANGNERGSGRCGTAYGTTAPPANAKNHITVGAINSNDESITSFTSWGPSEWVPAQNRLDGRIKPDVSAPGCQVGGDNGLTSPTADSNTAYGSYCGTSMASPTTAGCVALILQDFRVRYPAQPDPSGSMFKAWLANSAVDRGNVGPDYQFGFGSIRVVNAIEQMRSGAWASNTVIQDSAEGYTVVVPNGSGPLKITLAWDDMPATPNTYPALINDLDLEVISPSGTQHFVWTLDPANPGLPAVRTGIDRRNNIEQVQVDAPEAGIWQVRVRGFNVPAGGPQPFSLVSSAPLQGTGTFPTISMIPSQLAPSLIEPGQPTPVSVQIISTNETVVPGSVALRYRDTTSGTFQTIPMINTNGNTWQAALPAAACDTNPQYYFQATGVNVGVRTLPINGPTTPYSVGVGTINAFFADTFETDQGWTIGAPGDTATLGIWNRMDPEPTAAQPGDDSDDAGALCFVTDGRAGSSLGSFDVDGGTTTLTSPAFAVNNQFAATLSYWRWFSNSTGANPAQDTFRVQISNNNGTTWTPIETVGPAGTETTGGWNFREYTLGALTTPTNQTRVRFIAEDQGGGSIVEAAVDNFRIQTVTCTTPGCDYDYNQDENVDLLDAQNIAQVFVGMLTPGANWLTGDFNNDENVDLLDAQQLAVYVTTGQCP